MSATALVTILEGDVSVELLKSELARILPVKWDWEVHEHGDKAFVVPFPCKVELDRMVAIGSVITRHKEGVLLFEEYNTEIKPMRKLEQVWVRVFGVPYGIRSFLPLSAVGTILGATQKVDITYLRRTGVVRLLVAVLDSTAVPTDADIVVNRNMYRIFFKVDEVLRDEDFNQDNDDLLDDEDDRAEDQEMEDAGDSGDKGGDKPKRDEQEPHTTLESSTMLPHKQAALLKEILDIACAQVIEETSFKIMNEADDGAPISREGAFEVDLRGKVVPIPAAGTDTVTLAELGDAAMAEMGDVAMAEMGTTTKPMVGAAAETEMSSTDVTSIAAVEVVVADAGGVAMTEASAGSKGRQIEQEMFTASLPVEAEGVALATEAGSQLEQGAPPASLSTEAAGSQLPATKTNTGMSKRSEKIMKPMHAADTTLRRSNRMQARNDEHTLKKTTRLAERNVT